MDELESNCTINMKKLFYLFVIIFVASCASRETIIDKNELLGSDYRLFQSTPVWDLAKSVQDENVNQIKKLVLIDHLDVNYQEAQLGKTVLMLSILNDDFNSFKTLLECGANPNIHDTYTGSSAIIQAANIPGADTKYLTALLRHGANPNDEEVGERKDDNSTRNTPLLVACKNALEKVEVLVNAGANVDYRNEYNQTPLGESLLTDNLDIVLYLLEHGADYRKPITSTSEKKYYLWEELRFKLYPLNSKEYARKMSIVNFLSRNGIEYRNVPIPPYAFTQAQKEYPKNWKDYLKKY